MDRSVPQEVVHYTDSDIENLHEKLTDSLREGGYLISDHYTKPESDSDEILWKLHQL